ncbi:MAG: hypothetical protein K0S81_1576 [Rhodospirillales bacterium]|nr:hypothetical protein [Rhodospirillales bacterium]
MEYENGRIKGFELKFKSLNKDIERYQFALLDLLEAGKIELVPPAKSLIASHYYDEGYAWIVDSYFERGLLDQLERYFTPEGEVHFPPGETTRKYLDRMLEMGESARVRRIWRAYIMLMKTEYWFYVRQGQKYEELVAQIPGLKRRLLSVMTDYRALLVKTGATAAKLARLDADIAAIEAEKRPKPKGKTDNRQMTEDVFWELIDHGLGEQSLGERLDTLPERLALFKPAEIRRFDQILRHMDNAAYRNDIWALAYLLRGGCSDDSFEEFRGWLILQGREVFEATLANPDDFDVALYHGESGGMDALRDAAPSAFDLREGKPMKPVKAPLLELKGPYIDEEDFASYLPRVAAAMRAA